VTYFRIPMDKKRVLFVCIRNSARSQMAEAFFNRLCCGPYVAESAGVEPGALDPLAVRAMAEVGVDISRSSTTSVSDLLREGRTYAHVVTVCEQSARACPVFPGGGSRVRWSFPDPATLEGSGEEKFSMVRRIRDEIRATVEAWCAELEANDARS
jgi:arsenate reductase